MASETEASIPRCGQRKVQEQLHTWRRQEKPGPPAAGNSCSDSTSAGAGAVLLPHSHLIKLTGHGGKPICFATCQHWFLLRACLQLEKGSEPVSSRREEFYMRAGAAQGTISRRGRPTSHRSGGLGRLSVSTAVGSSGRRRVGVRHLRKARKTIQKVR